MQLFPVQGVPSATAVPMHCPEALQEPFCTQSVAQARPFTATWPQAPAPSHRSFVQGLLSVAHGVDDDFGV